MKPGEAEFMFCSPASGDFSIHGQGRMDNLLKAQIWPSPADAGGPAAVAAMLHLCA
jgi:hypothetical protein